MHGAQGDARGGGGSDGGHVQRALTRPREAGPNLRMNNPCVLPLDEADWSVLFSYSRERLVASSDLGRGALNLRGRGRRQGDFLVSA